MRVNLNQVFGAIDSPNLTIEVDGVGYPVRALSVSETRQLLYSGMTIEEQAKLIEDVVVGDVKPPLARWEEHAEPMIEGFVRVLIAQAQAVIAKKLEAVVMMTRTLTNTTATHATRSRG